MDLFCRFRDIGLDTSVESFLNITRDILPHHIIQRLLRIRRDRRPHALERFFAAFERTANVAAPGANNVAAVGA